MARDPINLGSGPNSRNGDTIRQAFTKIDDDLDELFDRVTDLEENGSSSAFSGYETIAAVQSASIPSSVDFITVHRYATGHPPSTAIYARVSQEPSHPGKVQSEDGGWWEIADRRSLDIRWFGAQCNGSADDTNAIDNAILALPELANSFGSASGEIYIPAGRTITAGGHVIPSTKRARLRGAGAYVSILFKKTGSTDDFVRFDAQHSGVQDLTLDGNLTGAGVSGTGLVLNGAQCYAASSTIANFAGTGIEVGRDGTAINFILRDLILRRNKGYGVEVYGSTSTDGNWFNVNVGTSGKSGVKIGSAAQKMHGVHCWGNGLESADDNHGALMVSGGHMLDGCEMETNLGNGIRLAVGINPITVSGGSLWGNVLSGVYGFNSHHHTFCGVTIKYNGVGNVDGTASTSYSGMENENCSYWVVSGCKFWENFQEIPAGSYSNPQPTYAYPGRGEVGTQSVHYGERDGGVAEPPNYNVITGNSMRADMSRTGQGVVSIGVKNIFADNDYGTFASEPTVASATSIAIPAYLDIVRVTGSVNIESIAPASQNRRVVLLFTDASPGDVIDGGNIRLSGNFSPGQNSTLSLMCDGTNWFEIARSTN